MVRRFLIPGSAILLLVLPGSVAAAEPSPEEVLAGLRTFYRATARPDGSFQPGLDPAYAGMSDCAHSDLAAVTYAVVIHATFGWELPDKAKTAGFLRSRQKETGAFFNVAGTVDPASAEGQVYNTTQGLVALHALGLGPRFNPLPVFEAILKEDYKSLPAFSTSFFPLAYLCAGQPIPEKADRGIRALMVQDGTGYLNDHIAATFHASHCDTIIWNADDATVAHRLAGHAGVVMGVAFSPDGATLASASIDGKVKLWKTESGTLDRTLDKHRLWVNSVAFFRDGKRLVSGSSDGMVIVWSVETGEILQSLTATNAEVRTVAVSPDGKYVAAGIRYGTVKVWETGGWIEKQTFQGHPGDVWSLAFSPDSRTLASGDGDWNRGGFVTLRDPATGRQLARFKHTGEVLSVAFSPDGHRLAASGGDGTVKVWNVLEKR